MATRMHDFINEIGGTTSIEWRQSIILPIWKGKGDRRECSQYRGISLISQPSKVFARILEKRIIYIYIVEPQLSANPFGFRTRKGCSDAISILRQLQEKHIEWKKPLYMTFIDQRKHSIELKSIIMEMPRRTGYFRRYFEGCPVSLQVAKQQ